MNNFLYFSSFSYNLKDVNLKNAVGPDALEKGKRKEVKKAVRKLFEERYQNANTKYFFQKLRF